MKTHRIASRPRQRGLSFFGLIFVGLIAVAAFAIGGQSVPIFLEYTSAKKAIEKAKVETTVPGVRAAFDRAAAIDDITSIKGSDLEVTKRGDKVVVFTVADNKATEVPVTLGKRMEGRVEVRQGLAAGARLALVDQARAEVGEISQALNSGRHTTTTSLWYWLDKAQGTAVIDSPGFQEFEIGRASCRERVSSPV